MDKHDKYIEYIEYRKKKLMNISNKQIRNNIFLVILLSLMMSPFMYLGYENIVIPAIYILINIVLLCLVLFCKNKMSKKIISFLSTLASMIIGFAIMFVDTVLDLRYYYMFVFGIIILFLHLVISQVMIHRRIDNGYYSEHNKPKNLVVYTLVYSVSSVMGLLAGRLIGYVLDYNSSSVVFVLAIIFLISILSSCALIYIHVLFLMKKYSLHTD